jgi:hypothetical protein
MNAYAFCSAHAIKALNTLTEFRLNDEAVYKISNVSKLDNFSCSCGKKARFYIREKP